MEIRTGELRSFIAPPSASGDVEEEEAALFKVDRWSD